MMVFLSIACVLLITLVGFVIYHALRWAKIIFILEDDLSEAIEIHERTVLALEAILKTQMFFDSPEIKAAVNEALENVRVCQTATQKLVHSLTQRSKQKYIRLVDTDEDN